MIKNSLVGRLLAASPSNPKDSLKHSVILVVVDDQKGSFGLQINRPIAQFSLRDVGEQMNIYLDQDDPVYYGGSIGSSKIHVIHTRDWVGDNTIEISDQLCVTNDVSVLEAIASGRGPSDYRACAGTWGWERGRLSAQVEARSGDTVRYRWETVRATPDLIFEAGEALDHWHRTVEAAAREQAASLFPDLGC